MRKIFKPTKYLLVGLLLICLQIARAERYHPKCLNAIASHLVALIKTKDKNAELKELPYSDPKTNFLELTYSDKHVFWYYITSIGYERYRVISIDKTTNYMEEYIHIPENDSYLPQSIVEILPRAPTENSRQSPPNMTPQPNQFNQPEYPTEAAGQAQRAQQTPPIFAPEQQQHGSQTNNRWQQQSTQPQNGYVDKQNSYNNNYETPVENSEPLPLQGNNWFSAPMLVGYSFTGAIIIWAYYLLHQAGVGARYLYREDLWSTWKSEESYDVLLMMKPKYLANDLIKDIHIKYYEDENPIALFFEDIEEEYDTILQWMQFRNTVLNLRLSVGPDFYTLENRLKLLERMRKAVNYWRSQQLSIENEAPY